MTHLHSIIKNALLPVCLETTAKARQEEEKSVEIDALVDPVMAELKKYFQDRKHVSGVIGTDYIKFMANCLAIVTRKPYLANAWQPDEIKQQVYVPLTVIMPNGSAWNDLTIGMIIIHGGNKLALNTYGADIIWSSAYPVRLATDEEVEHFLDSLGSTAIRKILKNDLFAPMIEAMTQETELVVEKTDEIDPGSEKFEQ